MDFCLLPSCCHLTPTSSEAAPANRNRLPTFPTTSAKAANILNNSSASCPPSKNGNLAKMFFTKMFTKEIHVILIMIENYDTE